MSERKPQGKKPYAGGNSKDSKVSEQKVKSEQKRIALTWSERSLNNHLGRKLMNDPAVAINELVANAWDAYATKVEIKLPKADLEVFSISDNGCSMTPDEFEERWGRMDYDRREKQGEFAEKPSGSEHLPDRIAYGRNGQGRFGAFCFTGESYLVETKKSGILATHKVSKSHDVSTPINIDKSISVESTVEVGTKIYGEKSLELALSADRIRAEIGLRYLHDPNFEVIVDGERVTFEHVEEHLQRQNIEVDGVGTVELIALDARKADKNSLRHGVSWQVGNRLIGKPDRRFIDGRRTAAKRFNFIVQAECLKDFIESDWSGFQKCDEVEAASTAVNNAIDVFLKDHSAEERAEIARNLKEKNIDQLRKMSLDEAEVWEEFVDKVQVECPTLKGDHLEAVAGILAKLEASKSKYSLLDKLRTCSSADFDAIDQLFENWSISTAKKVLDEVRWRLELMKELEIKMLDPNTQEVQDLQPIFDKGLWMFGPEFEAPDFTSNKAMSTVIKKFFADKATESGSANRPDFLIMQDSTITLKACPKYDAEVVGWGHVVIVELKAPRVKITDEESNQCMKYVKELLRTSAIQATTRVSCFLLGSSGDPMAFGLSTFGENRLITVQPMTYDTILGRAKARMLSLYDKLQEAPFFQKADGKKFLSGALGGTVFDKSPDESDTIPEAS